MSLKYDTNSVQYLSDSAILKDIEIFDSVDTTFSFTTNSFEVSKINIDLLQVSQTIFTIQANQINITNLNITNTKYLLSQLDANLINIISFINSQIENINSNNNQIQFLSMNQQTSEGIAFVSNAKFMNSSILSNNPLIFLNQLSNVELNNVLIKDVISINSQYTSIFTIQDCYLVTISYSHFTNNTNSNGPGGVIYAFESIQIIIQNSIFWLNTCNLQNGGAIYMINTVRRGILLINQTQLIENKSSYSLGGSIYLQNNNLIMQNSVIASNQAQIGGGIYYVQVMPDFLIDLQYGNKNNNTFKDNLAYIYGQNFGSTLRKVFIDLENIKIPKNSLKLYEDKAIFIKQLKSGDQINFEQIQLLDEENNPIRFIDVNSTDFQLLSNDAQSLVQQISVSVQWNEENKEIQCIGQLQTKQFRNGGFNLDAQIFYKPNSELVLKIVSNSFPSLTDSNGNIVVNQGQIELIFNIELEQCSIGQIFKQYGNSIACESCPDGKYSLSLIDQECKQCPDSAVQCIGSNIQLKDGYWRENENTDNIIYCSFNPQSCQPQLSSSKFYCTEGHIGPLCYQCDTYGDIWGSRYSEIYNHGDCYKCEENIHKIILYNLLVYLLISLYIFLILKRIILQLEVKVKGYYLNKLEIIYLGSTLNQSDRSQIISKILTDHFQILSLVCSFTTKMPEFFTIPIQLSGNSVSMVSKSIECAFSKHPNLKPLWLFEFLWSFSLSAGIFIFYFLKGIAFKRLKIDLYIRYLLTAAIFIYFYFYPMIITQAIRSINCIMIGDKKYLDLDFGIQCYDKNQHQPYLFLFTLPVIFIWGFLIPLFLFYKIYAANLKKKSIIKQIKYSFLFAGYKKQYYYWEFWKLFYKTILILISVLLKQNIQLKVFLIQFQNNIFNEIFKFLSTNQRIFYFLISY
ncbi:transmembrane protein, putative (macronuclear) [Tetrahymena thermophila SB210]|uniref:Transmembrane protein, putative n=1 Tax=Tetrahymena thermophila (strain SB210) TaxID=312017 RepID=W7XEJ1_TETTS|nr:transmembrane protein, putative [Tetrahymena thermophila SB210]EWS75098.1 transmembrane protein, putative [Tetrahymena thermophila SB210]|eukprot:XP_012652336.1 transmembrane protein, putative [Tetrahymena thermophila SB210]